MLGLANMSKAWDPALCFYYFVSLEVKPTRGGARGGAGGGSAPPDIEAKWAPLALPMSEIRKLSVVRSEASAL